MDFKPQTFFIGVVDFFSVWIPGAILTWFLKVQLYDPFPAVAKYLQLPSDSAALMVIFLVLTYMVGSIVFGIATFMDPLYDKWLRNLFKPKDRQQLDLEVKAATTIRESFINSNGWIENLYRQGKLTEQQYLKCVEDSRAVVYSYKWIQHYFLFKHPDALYDIKRVEADSKFFRSLVLTFMIMSVTLFITVQPIAAAIFLALSFLSLYLYTTNRYKATIRAYELMITYYHIEPSAEKTIPEKPLSSTLKLQLEDEN